MRIFSEFALAFIIVLFFLNDILESNFIIAFLIGAISMTSSLTINRWFWDDVA